MWTIVWLWKQLIIIKKWIFTHIERQGLYMQLYEERCMKASSQELIDALSLHFPFKICKNMNQHTALIVVHNSKIEVIN